MVLEQPKWPLRAVELPIPEAGAGQVRIAVNACAICRTDLHVVDGELADPKLPLVPGHQVVGIVDAVGDRVETIQVGMRVGVPWLGWVDDTCEYCRRGEENLCPNARFTGYQLDGGYAEWMVADARFCFQLPAGWDDFQVAPLLCAGAIGYRSLRLAGEGLRLGLYGFGASAHIVVQVARHRGQRVFAFVRPGDQAAAEFGLAMGAEWAGPSDAPGPEPLDAAIIFAPVGELIPSALRAVRPGGVVVCAGIHMSDIPSFPYELLWGERVLRSVANLTRRDVRELLEIAPSIPIRTEIEVHPLEAAVGALDRLRSGKLEGAEVLATRSANS